MHSTRSDLLYQTYLFRHVDTTCSVLLFLCHPLFSFTLCVSTYFKITLHTKKHQILADPSIQRFPSVLLLFLLFVVCVCVCVGGDNSSLLSCHIHKKNGRIIFLVVLKKKKKQDISISVFITSLSFMESCYLGTRFWSLRFLLLCLILVDLILVSSIFHWVKPVTVSQTQTPISHRVFMCLWMYIFKCCVWWCTCEHVHILYMYVCM